jgi:tripartite-type tricarboxylate transporter receptor subunit TctC
MSHAFQVVMQRRHLLGAATLAALSPHGFAETYPSRQVRFIVPFPAGGPMDTVGRAVGQRLTEVWGQPVVVDNRAGAGGLVGADVAAKSPHDGYTVLVCSIHHTVLPSLQRKLPYDIERDFAPLTFGTRFPIVLVAHPSLPVRNVAELIALDKTKPRSLSFASAGNGGGTHLAGELFNMLAGTQMQHVPYKGSAPAMSDLLGNQVALMFSDAPTAIPQIRAGKVRAIAMGSAQRWSGLPDLPTVAESGLNGYEAYSWAAFVAPAGTPGDVVNRLSTDIGQALNQPDVRQRLQDVGAEAAPGTPQEMAQLLRSEMSKWAQVVRTGRIQMD